MSTEARQKWIELLKEPDYWKDLDIIDKVDLLSIQNAHRRGRLEELLKLARVK